MPGERQDSDTTRRRKKKSEQFVPVCVWGGERKNIDILERKRFGNGKMITD